MKDSRVLYLADHDHLRIRLLSVSVDSIPERWRARRAGAAMKRTAFCAALALTACALGDGNGWWEADQYVQRVIGSWEQGALGHEGEPAPQQWPEGWRIDINEDGTFHLWNELTGWTGKGRWTYTDKYLRLRFHGSARDQVVIVEWVWEDAVSAESERYGSFGAWLRRPPG